MQHIFITGKLSIYVVVICLARDPHSRLVAEDADHDLTQLQDMHVWLNAIHLQAPQAKIVVVGTHAQVPTASALLRHKWTITQSFEGTPFKRQIETDPESGWLITCVDSKDDSDAVFASLRQRLFSLQQSLPAFNDNSTCSHYLPFVYGNMEP